jgi:uncharacterized membrane protein YkgB
MAAPRSTARSNVSSRIERVGHSTTRLGLVVVLGWIGAMKFTAYEAAGIQPLVAASPLMSWAYRITSVQGFSNVLGVLEIAMALMIAFETAFPRTAAVGAGLAVATFSTTLTFLFSTPGWEPSLGGFPALAVVPGQFLLKDLVLLGAAVQLLGRALGRIEEEAARRPHGA